jgi:hypothetical protein
MAATALSVRGEAQQWRGAYSPARHPARAVIALGLAASQWMLADRRGACHRSWAVSRRRDGRPFLHAGCPLQLSLAAAALQHA